MGGALHDVLVADRRQEHRGVLRDGALVVRPSAQPDAFLLEFDGVPVGAGSVRPADLERILDVFREQRTARVDVQVEHDSWGRGIGTRAVRLLTGHAFDRGYDVAFGLDIAGDDDRIRRAFLRCGYVPWRRVKTAQATETRFVYDVICRPDHYFGRAAVADHPGADEIMAGDRPGGATIVVYRRQPELQVLLLHRAHSGPDYEGDWAWTPPAGARFPAEPIEHCAARELHEEVGLDANPRFVAETESGWAIHVLELPAGAGIELDDEHDRYEWVAPGDARNRCLPVVVGDSITTALRSLA